MLRRKIQPATEINPLRVLIFLLAVGGLLGVILMPKTSNGTSSAINIKIRVQLSQYQTALTQFENEYGYFPTFLDQNGRINLSEPNKSREFIEGLSARTIDGKVTTSHGNKKAIPFMSFSENEYTMDDDGGIQIINAFGDPQIIMACDIDGDGIIHVESEGKLIEIRTQIAGYTVDEDGEISIATWD